jgi:hypothetical protein
MNLEHLKVQEMNLTELTSIDGGGFWDDLTNGTVWSGTSNELAYFFEAVYNGGVMAGNLGEMAAEGWSSFWGSMSSVMPT